MERSPRYLAIMASNLRGIIGDKGSLPWKSKEDLAYFRAFTNNKPIVMGRKTFESVGRKLPNRTHIVISRNSDYTFAPYQPDLVFTSIREPLYAVDRGPLCLIGGGDILAQAFDLDLIESLHQTIVHDDTEGDTLMPTIPENFTLIHSNHVAHYNPPLTFKVYQKKWQS